MQKDHSKEILLVTFPVDLGNRTYEKNLHKLFGDRMDFFRFAAQHVDELDNGINYGRSIRDRLLSIFSLRRALGFYTEADKRVLFHGLSPAFLSYGSWNSKNTAILLDWTRLLYPSVLGGKIKKNWLFYLHRSVLRKCPKILCMTEAVKNNLLDYYGIPSHQLFKVPAPFNIEIIDIYPRPTPNKPRVLFVGGDLKRKGGDILLDNWEKALKGKCILTMLTNDQTADIEGVNYRPGIKYGTSEHRKIFEESDILILPTKIDSYPQAIGEAAAAGLAVITTRFALGASEVVLNNISGYVEDTQYGCLEKLINLIENKDRIDQFKRAGYEHMHSTFSNGMIQKSYLKVLEI